MDLNFFAGGRCQGGPWRIGIVTSQTHAPEQFRVLSDAQWEWLNQQLPMAPLQEYGKAHGLVFDRITSAQGCDSVLSIMLDESGGAVLTLEDSVQRYVLCLERNKFSLEGTGFQKVFLPSAEAFNDPSLIRLNQPLEPPASTTVKRKAIQGRASIFGRDDIDLKNAHFALCDVSAQVDGWLPWQWQAAWLAGAIPVHTGEYVAPDWLPQDCYVDGSTFQSREELLAYLDGMLWEDYRLLHDRLQSFLLGDSAYPYTVDFWLNGLTAAIAANSAQGRGTEPLLSIVIPTYNHGRFLEQAVRSVLEQGVDALEVLVLDNASTDGTQSVMSRFANEPRVRYMRNRRNLGAGNNAQNGFWIATGRYLITLMADDFMNPGHLQRLLPVMEANPHIAVAYSPICWVSEQGKAIERPRHPGHKQDAYVGGRNEVADLLVYDNYITPSAAIIRREMFLKAWQRDSRIDGAGDWAAMILIADKFPDFAYVPEPGVSYRVHAGQHSHKFYVTIEPLTGHFYILQGIFERGSQHKIKRRAPEIAEHLRRRLAYYPNEHNSELAGAVRDLCGRLDALVRSEQEYLFSIILTTYNRPQLLKDALASIGQQTVRDFEVILVNDHGEPVEKLLQDYAFPITYIYQGTNQGLSAARNAGLKLAHGRYITYLDDDDIYLPNHLQSLADVFAAEPDVLAYTDVVYVWEKLEDGCRLEQKRAVPTAHAEHSRDLLFARNYMPVNTWAHPRALLAEVGEFDTSLSAFEDWDMLLRLVQRCEVRRVSKVTAEVRQRVASGNDHMLAREQKNLRGLYEEIYRRYPELGNESIQSARRVVLDGLPKTIPGRTWGVSEWLSERAPSAARVATLQAILAANPQVGTLGVVVYDTKGDTQAVRATFDSIKAQHRLTDGCWVISPVETAGLAEDGLQWVCSNEPWPRVLNGLLEQEGLPEYLLAIPAGDALLPQALLLMGAHRLERPGSQAWYVDEDTLIDGVPDNPMLKPDFNLDMLRSYPYIGRVLGFSTAVAKDIGGLDAALDELALVDLVWRLVELDGPPAIGHISEVLVRSGRTLFDWVGDELVAKQSRITTEAHLTRLGVTAALSQGARPGLWNVRYELPVKPFASIIIPTRNHFPILQKCIESLMEKTQYTQYELLIVDNDSNETDACEFLNELESLGSDQIRILRWPEAFDFSKINNFAARQARGDVLLFLNNDIEVVTPEWLSVMLSHALRSEVGIVGARLDYPDGRVQHAGLILGMENSVGFAFQGQPGDWQGYMGRLQITQNVSAVTGACLMIRKDVFDELNGFDEESFSVYYGDVDLALRARQAGFLTVWASEVRLVHLGGATRLLTDRFGVAASPDDADRDRLYTKWLPQLGWDPAYHPAYGKKTPGFDLTSDAARIQTPLPGRPLPVVLASHSDWHGCGYYRIIHPYQALEASLRIEGGVKFGDFHFTDVARTEPDVIVLQGAWVNEGILKQIERYQNGVGSKVVLEFDDYVPNIPVQSVYRKKIPQSAIAKIRRTMEKVDWLVVSTPALAAEYAHYHHDIRVAQNGLFNPWWENLVTHRGVGKKPRVGWAGGIGHTGDLAVIRSLVKDLQNEVEWIFMGMQPKDIACEFHPGVPIDQYPQKLASLNLDLAVVPLEINQFNTCKSNLRLLELGICGVPVICTDIEPYRCDLPVTRVRNRYQSWAEAIRSHLADRDAAARAGDELRAAVLRDWMLEGVHLDQWANAWLEKP